MITFEQFVKSLGPHADLYNKSEHLQLHAEIEVLANVLLDRRRSRVYGANRNRRSPQRALDDACTDRTMTKKLTEHAQDGTSSAAHIS